jgi:hypothetical protein
MTDAANRQINLRDLFRDDALGVAGVSHRLAAS